MHEATNCAAAAACQQEGASSVSVHYGGVNKELASTDNILGEVEAIMAPLKTVTDQEIVVKICQVDVPTIELVDLPGIQLYPRPLEKETTNLVHKYLDKPDTLVLCVVDATISSLDSAPAVKIVRQARKLSSTILALTKADLVTDEEVIVSNIFDRILAQSDEMHELPNLAGCVALVNRKHTDQLSLLEAEDAEKITFEKLFHDPADAYKPEAVQKQLQNSTTTAQLIAKLDELFHCHIAEHWLPAALQSLNSTISDVKSQYRKLGPAPEKLTVEQVLDMLTSKAGCDINAALRDLPKVQIKNIPVKDGPRACELPFLDTLLAAQNLQWGSYAWTVVSTTLHGLVTDAVQRTLSSTTYLGCAVGAVHEAFRVVFTSSQSTTEAWQLGRFASLKAELFQAILPQVVAKALAESQPIIINMVESTFSQNYGQVFPADTFRSLDCRIRGCILQQLHAATADPANLIKNASADQLKLREDEQSAQKRSALQTKLQQLQGAVHAIKDIASLQASSASASAQQEHVMVEISLDDDDDDDEEGALTPTQVPSLASRVMFTWPETTTDSPSKRRKHTHAADDDAAAADVKTPDGQKARTKATALREKKRLRPTPVPSA